MVTTGPGGAAHTAAASRYDVIIVGSGAAGSFAAKELTEQGLSVVVLDAGRRVGPADFTALTRKAAARGVQLWARILASLTGQPLQARVAFFNAAMKRFLVKDWLHPYRTPKDAPFLWVRGRQVGGRLHVFGRVLFRWSDHEFAGAWPIRYDDLAAWYEKVERFLGLHGNRDGAPAAPDGVMAEPARLTPQEIAFRQAVERRWRDRQVVAWRFAPPDRDAMPPALAAALESGRATLQPDAVATEILADPATGRASGVDYVDRQTGRRGRVLGAAVVVCASPVESVRLLLNSRSPRHPDGLGNSSGLLGRCFMDQPASLVFGTLPSIAAAAPREGLPAHPLYGVTGGVVIPRYANLDAGNRDDVRGGYSFQGSAGRDPTLKPGQRADAVFMGYGEMQPYGDNRITLDPRRRDRWGVPLPVIRCALHDNERRMLTRQIAEVVEMVEAAGGSVNAWASPLGLVERGEGLYPKLNPLARAIVRWMLPKSMIMGAAIHESGGARMGSDPATSVLNRFNQVWDAPNVLVTDASAFPTGGSMGTTLTVMALTTRACARLAHELKAGRL
jgi:choline dehydrogenase-like flavoprotein